MRPIKLKICGLMSADEARLAIKYGADYAGINFVPTSQRRVSIETAQSMLEVLKKSDIKTVAVFQDQPLAEVREILNSVSVDYVQLHGSETPEYAVSLALPVIRAISDQDQMANFQAEYFLLDRPTQGKGSLVDLKLAEQIIDSYPGKVFLAGGLMPDNMAVVLSTVQPYAVDIASGVRTDNKLDESKLLKVIGIINQANSHESVKL